MSKDTKNLPVHEMDTNILFEKFSVDEIRNIEKQTRSNIERKKEDLRTMVGERYRDLIEAADTITEMKTSSQKVMGTIGKIENLCSDLKQSHMIKGSNLHHKRKLQMDNKKKEEARFYGVASQIKLLLDIPEKIWTCLDFEDYLTASRLYLLSQHINTSLHLDSQNAPNFLYWFPVLNRQWAAISHFKFTILQGCRKLLKEPAVPDKKIAESLCSILLLENSNPRQVFNEFLLARTSAIQQLFNVNNQSGSTKDQICVVTQLITTTIHQIHSVFYTQNQQDEKEEDENTNLLLKILNKVTSVKQCDTGIVDLQNSVSAKCLPKSVSEFCPSHKSMSVGVSEQHRHDNCSQWIQTCTSDVKSGVSKLLNFVNSVKHLTSIRDTVWELMSKDTSLENWEVICGRVLNKSLHIWDDLLRPLFVGRVQALIKYQIETSVEYTQRQISSVFNQLDHVTDEGSLTTEVDLSSYIWSESPSDIAASRAWGSGGSRSLLESGGLMMKARALTPVVQNLCRHFDEKLKSMNEDCKTYLYSDVDNLTVTMETTPFNRYADSVKLLTFTQETCVTGVKGMVQFLTDLSNECKETIKEATERCGQTGNKLLLVGRLCSALCDLTPNLQLSMLGSEQLKQDRMKRSVTGRLTSKDINTVWEETKQSLVTFQFVVYRVWIDHIVAIAGKGFSNAVQSENACDLLRICDRWDEVSIEEETQDGKKITSKISVPMQASSYLLSLLYGLCNDLNYIGGHSVQRRVLEHLVYSVSDRVIDVYKQLLSTHKADSGSTLTGLNQHRALQTLFDIKFLQMIIPRKEDTKESKVYQSSVNKLISDLEEMIDPFDLDVFFPYIQSNLSKLAQRSSVLLGGLTSIDKSSFYGLTSRPSPSSQQEQHNVLLLSTCNSRFSLLPLSMQQSRFGAPQPVITQTLFRSAESMGPTLTETAAATLPANSQDKMISSSSFYDKIGTGLGSMSEISNWFSTIGSK